MAHTVEDIIKSGGRLLILFQKENYPPREHIKKFNSVQHYENYCTKMMNAGWKELGTNEYTQKPMEQEKILLARKEIIEYTNDQREALLLIQKFLAVGSSNYFLLIGNAGTGKTTIAENVAHFAKATLLAPTNAAVKRLSDKFGIDNIGPEKFRTIHQILYGAPDPITGKFTPKEGLAKNGVYCVDEASMIDKKVLEDLMESASDKNAKLIFIGDDFQLEPVGKDPNLFQWEKSNKEFKKEWKIKLNEVKRNEGTILQIATHLRSCDNPEIINFDQPDFQLLSKFSSALPLQIRDDENYIVLCSTNKKRMEYNKHIRRARFENESKLPINNYERLIAVANTCFLNGELFTITNPTIIEKMTEEINIGNRDNPEYRELDMYLVQHEIQDMKGLFKTLVIPYLDKPSLYPQMLMTSNAILYNPRLTEHINTINRRVWRKDITIATYGYATSVHKSQGNEWDHVYIDCDWLSPAWNHSRWLYTAITRAKKTVELTHSKYFKIIDP